MELNVQFFQDAVHGPPSQDGTDSGLLIHTWLGVNLDGLGAAFLAIKWTSSPKDSDSL